MGDLSGWFAQLRQDTNRITLDFLKTSLDTCFVFANVAETEYQLGEPDGAYRALKVAEHEYGSLLRYLSDRKHAGRLEAEDVQRFRGQMRAVREKLDGLKALPQIWIRTTPQDVNPPV